MTIPGEGTIAVTGRRWHEPVGWQFPGGTRVHADVDGLLRPRDTRLLDPGDNERARRQYQYNLENHIVPSTVRRDYPDVAACDTGQALRSFSFIIFA